MNALLLAASLTVAPPAMTDDLAAYCQEITIHTAAVLLPIIERLEITPEMVAAMTDRQAFLFFLRSGNDDEAEALLMLADASTSAGCQF